MIEKLPELVLTKVFKHLRIYDQLAIRPVCKSWKAVVENRLLARRELILFHKNCPGLPLVWFHDGSSVNLTNSLISNDQFKPNQFFWQIFQNIRRLYIVCYEEFLYEPDHLRFVNRFILLEHLQVDVLPYDDIENEYWPEDIECVLDTPNLKSFCCTGEMLSMNFQIRNSPKLEMLAAPCYFHFDEKRCGSFRESLKFLKVQNYYFKPGFFFPNLESFHFQRFTGHYRDRLKIALHPKLKEIHFYSDFYRGKHYNIYPSDHLNALFKQKKLLGWRKPDFFCLGLRWTPESAGAIMHLPRSYLNETEVQLFRENSKHLKLEHAKRNLIYAPDFDNYLAALDEQQLERLARCIEVVEFPEILKNDPVLASKYQILFRYVRFLRLSGQFREQRDLDRLPELFPHLWEIREGSLVSLFRRGISSEGCSNPRAFPHLFRKAFNFDFLARFPALTRLEIDRWTLSRGELERIMQNSRFLREIKFSRRQLVGSMEIPIRTEYFVFTISSLRSTAIKMKVFRQTFHLIQEPAYGFVPFKELPDQTFGSFQEMIQFLHSNGFFFDEN